MKIKKYMFIRLFNNETHIVSKDTTTDIIEFIKKYFNIDYSKSNRTIEALIEEAAELNCQTNIYSFREEDINALLVFLKGENYKRYEIDLFDHDAPTLELYN